MRNQCAPSPTALLSAAARGAHYLVDDEPHLIDDVSAMQLCEKYAPQALEYHRSFPHEPVLAAARLSACMRRRFAEDIAEARGFPQCLLLGGGLDAALPRVAATWVADRPEVLRWRKEIFDEAGIANPANALPIDLGNEDLAGVLTASGIDRDLPVLVVWLGVSMYLDHDAIVRVLRALTTLSERSTVVFDYVLPTVMRDEKGTHYAKAVGAQVAGRGEPWRTVLTPDEASDLLSATGWMLVRDVPEEAGAGEGFWPRTDGLSPMSLIRFVEARRVIS